MASVLSHVSCDHEILLLFLRERFDLDLATGVLTWKQRLREQFVTTSAWAMWNARFAGEPAGWLHYSGYLQTSVNFNGRKRQLMVHRIVWALMTGAWPRNEIDHRTGIRDDNRPKNLREATHAENQHNQRLVKRNTSGFPGVHWDKPCGKWRARITLARRRINLGLFPTREAAFAAYLAAKAIHHPFQPIPRHLLNNPA